MEWEDIVPQRGVRIKQSPGVTVALRVPASGRPMMTVTIGREMRDTLGWRPKQRVRVQRNMAAGLVRLSLTDEPGAGYALHGSGANSCLGAAFHFPGLPAERRRAEPAENRIEEGALIAFNIALEQLHNAVADRRNAADSWSVSRPSRSMSRVSARARRFSSRLRVVMLSFIYQFDKGPGLGR